MDDGETFEHGSAAEAVDEASHAVQASVEPPEGTQVIPVATDEGGDGWGLVGMFKDGIASVDTDGGGEVELEEDANGITKLNLSGASPSSTVNLTVTPKI